MSKGVGPKSRPDSAPILEDEFVGTGCNESLSFHPQDASYSPHQSYQPQGFLNPDIEAYQTYPQPITSAPVSHSYPFGCDQQPIPSSEFTYNPLTPEYSENPYSISSAQTISDTGDFLSNQELNEAGVDGFVVPSGGTTYQQAIQKGLPGIVTRQSSEQKTLPTSAATNTLLSPQLTNTPSPPRLSHHQMHPEGRRVEANATGSSYDPGKSGSGSMLFDIQINMRQSNMPADTTLPDDASGNLARAFSPVVMVSSYERGDSPGRSGFPMGRSSSKRSHTSRSSTHLNPNPPEQLEDEDDVSQENKGINHTSPKIQRTDDGSWIAPDSGGLGGIDPSMRGNENVQSLKELEEQRQLDEKNAEVETWLATSDAGRRGGDETAASPASRPTNREGYRSRSQEKRSHLVGLGMVNESSIPGPGALLDEDSEEELSEHSSEESLAADESPPAAVELDTNGPDKRYFQGADIDQIPPEEEEQPLPRQFYKAKPWHDGPRTGNFSNTKDQPVTSIAAIVKFHQQAARWETASRAATWGTRRRLSETDLASIVGDSSKLQDLSISGTTKRERGASFINRARGAVLRRASSHNKKKVHETGPEPASAESPQKRRGDSLGSIKALQRIPSFGKSKKTPSLDTGGALVAMAGQLAAVGRSSSATPELIASPPSPWKTLKRQRSKSEIPKQSVKPSTTPGITELVMQHGGLPMPPMISPIQAKPKVDKRSDEGEEDEEDEDCLDEGAVKMEFKIRSDDITPTLEGFKSHALQLNPRLEPFLADRIASEQLRRYKKLVENKVKHATAVRQHQKCSSGSHCFDLGGEATLLPPRQSQKDPDTTYAQFSISGAGESENDGTTFAEGPVTAALFPPGIPLPPAKKLPAEFECILCFKVKKFQKPSDWTKHVHEDIQPFTCTFPQCTEPKSFKRKADWVRHENERHRHIEWWQCNMPECNHVCYRKDNFVQHLVREHKKAEPKVKSRGSGSSKAQPVYVSDPVEEWKTQIHEKEVSEVWRLVDSCRVETQRRPKDEACKFCGNNLNSWKKLTVHLAKHMEQIVMPVLELVKQEVGPETVISPIEQHPQTRNLPQTPQLMTSMKPEPNSLSPYAMNATPQYEQRSSRQSPVNFHGYLQSPHAFEAEQPMAGQNANSTAQMQPADMATFARVHGLPENMSYGPYSGVAHAQRFMQGASAAPMTYPPAPVDLGRERVSVPGHIPRSHPVQTAPFQDQIDPLQTTGYTQAMRSVIYGSPTDGVDYSSHLDVLDQNMGSVPPSSIYDAPAAQPAMAISRPPVFHSPSSLGFGVPHGTQDPDYGPTYPQ